MQLRVTGKNMDLGDALRGQVNDRLGSALGKYFDGGYTAEVVMEREGSGIRTECHVHLDTGIDLQSHGASQDPYTSFDQAAERIEKRLRRYKSRLKDHHANAADALAVTDYTIAAPAEEDVEELPADDNPVIIAETPKKIRSMTPGMAVMALDLAQAPVLVFTNAATGRLNVVYRREDGNFGWINPPETAD